MTRYTRALSQSVKMTIMHVAHEASSAWRNTATAAGASFNATCVNDMVEEIKGMQNAQCNHCIELLAHALIHLKGLISAGNKYKAIEMTHHVQRPAHDALSVWRNNATAAGTSFNATRVSDMVELIKEYKMNSAIISLNYWRMR